MKAYFIYTYISYLRKTKKKKSLSSLYAQFKFKIPPHKGAEGIILQWTNLTRYQGQYQKQKIMLTSVIKMLLYLCKLTPKNPYHQHNHEKNSKFWNRGTLLNTQPVLLKLIKVVKKQKNSGANVVAQWVKQLLVTLSSHIGAQVLVQASDAAPH